MLDLNPSVHQSDLNHLTSNYTKDNSSKQVLEVCSRGRDKEQSYSCPDLAYRFDILKPSNRTDDLGSGFEVW
ncbi:hypothetical protein HanRHA438_Chr10g0443201 [Helianthus annuus]|nr:hypothetical protein HanIR_Chr10g0464521 [Helianthus annuus]KAJ0878740.1 hypothetical protein HanRHA438_Chr10g0443201 [Helianthus annuus]